MVKSAKIKGKGIKGIKAMKQKVGKRGTIKTRLIVVPLIVVFLVILSIGVISSYFLENSLLDEMDVNGTYLAERLIVNLNDNSKALGVINDSLDKEIESTANTIISSVDMLSNEFLKTVASNLDVEEISWYSPEGKILYSNIDELVGWAADSGHIVYDFMIGQDNRLVEDVREDSISKDFLKFGYFKSSDGSFVQIGINANRVHEITEHFEYQNFLNEIVKDQEIYYALIMDSNAQVMVTADGIHDTIAVAEVGRVMEDEGSKSAAIDGIPFTHEWGNKEEGINILTISYPLVIDGEHTGALSIGYTLKHLQDGINKNVTYIMIIALIAFAVLGLILYSASSYVAKIINKLKIQVGYMEQGDFSKDISADLISKNDELGEISNALSIMQNSIRGIIGNVVDISQSLAASSEELTATSQQSTTAAHEVATAIEDIANGATEQAEDTQQGVASISELGDIVTNNTKSIADLNKSAKMVTNLKDEGLEILRGLVEKTDSSGRSSREVHQVIINTNESAERIANASDMIRSIADQTNLLALNAAIEAARAGDAGRGFAVVADEIRKLAEQSSQFTEEIGTIVDDLTSKTLTAVKTMEELEEIVLSQTESVDTTNNKFIGIASAIEEMGGAIKEVNESGNKITIKEEEIIGIMENLSAISEENAAGTEEASASVEEQTAAMEEIANSSEQLSTMAEELNNHVRQFRV